MRKVVLALIVSMLAVPALAGVTVDCTIDGNEVTVTYEMVGGDPNLPRAFGLEIIADANISIDQTLPSDDINDSDFYIYPGTIDVNDDGTVDAYGTPVAILDANTMTIEMGSLYSRPPQNDPDHNTPPPSSGWVIKFRVAKNPAETINVDLRENVDRGGVVMEDVNYSGDVVCGDCTNQVEGYEISGTVTYDVVSTSTPLSGVTMNGLPSVPVTDGNGDYDDTVSSGWSGTVTPSKTGYGFDPCSIDYSNVLSDQLDQDYCAYPGCWDWPGQCKGDCHGDDGDVDTDDFIAFKDAFGAVKGGAGYNPCADFDRDGDIDTDDFIVFKDNFGQTGLAGCTPGDIPGTYCP